MFTFAVFEGPAHPYKQNILKDNLPPPLSSRPEVQVAFAEAAEEKQREQQQQ